MIILDELPAAQHHQSNPSFMSQARAACAEGFYFLFPVLMERSSKLLDGSTLLPRVAPERIKEDDLDPKPGCSLWMVAERWPPPPPLLETRQFGRPSLRSPEGRLFIMTAFFKGLPLRKAYERLLSESSCWKKCRKTIKRYRYMAISLQQSSKNDQSRSEIVR